jgi:iron complex outermembrane receptor protein
MSQNRIRSAAIACLCFVGGTLAQAAIAQQSRSDSGQLEEIVVTAEKRESTVQKTAISLTAVSGADIQDRGSRT